MPSRPHLEVRSARSPVVARRRDAEAEPLGLLVVGDFGGRSASGSPPATDAGSAPQPVSIDVDTFEQVLARHAPRLALPLGEPVNRTIEIGFTRLEDFHPDSLLERVDLFKTIPAIALAAAGRPAADRVAGDTQPEPGPSSESDTATLERLLGGPGPGGRSGTTSAAGPPVTGSSRPVVDIGPLIRRIVGPHVVPATGPRQEIEKRITAGALSAVLRSVLHHPDFQALEAGWRSLHRFVTHLEGGTGLHIGLMDVSRDRLETVLRGGVDPAPPGTLSLPDGSATLEAPGESWAVIVANYTFGPSPDDLALLAALGAWAERLNATLLADADALLLGCRSLAESPTPGSWTAGDSGAAGRWDRLRREPSARSIGLAIPRVVLRRPYGRRSDPVERLDFEEMEGHAEHEHYLWGNGAWVVAEVIARSFADGDGTASPEDNLVLDDLPACVEDGPGGTRLLPCAETLLGEAAADAILARGLMLIRSYRDRAAARLVRLQSVADPPAPLRGSWTRLPRG